MCGYQLEGQKNDPAYWYQPEEDQWNWSKRRFFIFFTSESPEKQLKKKYFENVRWKFQEYGQLDEVWESF